VIEKKILNNWLKNNFHRVIEIRRWLHKNPELGFQEYKTSKFCQSIIEKAGLKIYYKDGMKTGFYCEFGNKKGPVLALRCDLDALPILEANKINYKSQNKGVSHACGHDVHMANIIGTILFFLESKIEISGKIRFIFQPAEEIAPGGAEMMINSGSIEGADHIIAAHVLPQLSSNMIGVKYGDVAARVELIEIIINGSGGHTSRPHKTENLILIQAQLLTLLEETINNYSSEKDPIVLVFGEINGGDASNIIPDQIKIKGTLRYFNLELKSQIYGLISDVIKSIEKISNAQIKWEIKYASPGLINDKFCADLIIEAAKDAIGKENVSILEKGSMGGEDFSYYLERIPGAYFRIGCSDGYCRDIHTKNFNVDEKCMETAIKVFTHTIIQYFRGK